MKDKYQAVREIGNSYRKRGEEAIALNIEATFLAGIEFAEQWIGVKDELPKQGDDILVKFKDGSIIAFTVIANNFSTLIDAVQWRPINRK